MNEDKAAECGPAGAGEGAGGEGAAVTGAAAGPASEESAADPECAAPAEDTGPEDPGEGSAGDATAQVPPAAEGPLPEELEGALEEARREAQSNMDMVLRVRAELENVRRRAERDVANAHKYGLERVVNEMLPVRDSLELGVSAAGDDVDVAQVREGMELTLKLMAAAFDKLGLEVVDPAGQDFDPDLHQAMSMQEGAEGQSGKVLTVVQKGYRLNGRLVRPALVVVAR